MESWGIAGRARRRNLFFGRSFRVLAFLAIALLLPSCNTGFGGRDPGPQDDIGEAGSPGEEPSAGPETGVSVLLTSRRTPPLDLGQWRSQGVDPENLFVKGIKAAIEHRPAYAPIARVSYTVDLPGPSAENLGRLPFEHVSRPVYPLDEM